MAACPPGDRGENLVESLEVGVDSFSLLARNSPPM